MSKAGRGNLMAGLLGLTPWGVAAAQDLPEALPPLPAEAPPARVLALPPVILVPPGGITPTWGPGLIDPAAAPGHPPKFREHKLRSWHWHKLQARFLGYPEEYHPRPLGASVYDHARVMVANGAAAGLCLYRYDFVEGTSRLSDRGVAQLAKAASQLAASPYPLLIEWTPEDPGLADARRLAVLQALAFGPVPVAPSRVLVGSPIPHGMSGIDAQIVGSNALDRVKDYGPPIPINSNGVNSPSGVTTNR